MSRDQHLWCYDGDHEQFVKYDLRGHIETVFGRYGTYPGATWGVHQISADAEGNLYGAEVFGGRTQKFVPKPNANPRDLFFGPRARAEDAGDAADDGASGHRRATTTAAEAEPEHADFELRRHLEFRQGTQPDGRPAAEWDRGVAEPPIAMTVKQTGERDRDHDASMSPAQEPQAECAERTRTAVFTLDGKMTQTPDPADPRPQHNYKRIADVGRRAAGAPHDSRPEQHARSLGARREQLRMQRAAQTPGGADSATRALIYTKGS